MAALSGGQRGRERCPPEPHPGTLDRAHRRPGDTEPLAPPTVEPSLREETIDLGQQPDQPEGLGRAQLVGQEGREGARAPVGRVVTADHQGRRAGRPKLAGDGPGQRSLVASQVFEEPLVRAQPVAPAIAWPLGMTVRTAITWRPGDPEHLAAEGDGVTQRVVGCCRSGRDDQDAGRPCLGDPQGVFHRGLVGRRQPGPVDVAGDRPGQRVDIRSQVGVADAGHDQWCGLPFVATGHGRHPCRNSTP